MKDAAVMKGKATEPIWHPNGSAITKRLVEIWKRLPVSYKNHGIENAFTNCYLLVILTSAWIFVLVLKKDY